jgi:hypothetical protein
MNVTLPEAERQLLRQAQRACRSKAGYVPVPALLMLDRGRAVAAVADDLGLDEATVYRYAKTYHLHGLVSQSRAARLHTTYGVRYSVSGLTDLLHRLGFSCKQTTAVPCQADAGVQTAFLTQTLSPLLTQAEAGEAVVYFADAAHPTHNPHHPRVDANGQRTPAAHRQRPGTDQSQRRHPCRCPHPGARR